MIDGKKFTPFVSLSLAVKVGEPPKVGAVPGDLRYFSATYWGYSVK
jgi:hypothetical protein